MGELRNDLIPEELKEDRQKIIVQRTFDGQIARGVDVRSTSLGSAKGLSEVYSLVQEIIRDEEKRLGVSEGLTLEESSLIQVGDGVYQDSPTANLRTPAVTFSLMRRAPGAYSEGSPFEGKVRNLRPILREVRDDPQNPGYRLAIRGYIHDNIIRLTCWSATNHEANALAEKIERLMERYSFHLVQQGVPRIFFWARGSDQVIRKNGENLYYGRPIEYFVKTETLDILSEKALEEILFNVHVSEQG